MITITYESCNKIMKILVDNKKEYYEWVCEMMNQNIKFKVLSTEINGRKVDINQL